MKDLDRLHAPPKAVSMLEALRGLGYSAHTALADIIDNSIAANASRVDLEFSWAGERSYVSVLDNGRGMDGAELFRAMRLGDKSPLDQRDGGDLGRFGLGLKTASFSQARRLTVATKRDDAVSCLRWDLDVLANSEGDGWYMLQGAADGSASRLHPIEGISSGTLVLWEVMDRLVTPGFSEQDFLDLVDVVERHLAMVFHRYLAGIRPRLTININGRAVAPWDPFLASHPATWSSPVERLNSASGTVEVQCHVLPHKDRMDAELHAKAAGPDGWTAQQGFYVYRNQRLLLAGSWLGLGRGRAWTKEEAHRLARIRIDLPNTADTDWKIDIRKSVARPPVAQRNRLVRLAEDARERARRVFAHRGGAVRQVGPGQIVQAWRAEQFKGGVRYRIDISHPAVHETLDQAGELRPQLLAMLKVIEETIPVQRIWLDTTESKETPRTGFADAPPKDVIAVLDVMYRNLVVRKGLSTELARARLRNSEPFNNYPQLVDALPEIPREQE